MRNINLEEILENFVYENPSESVYKITGVRGSGKTVILAKVEEELKNKNYLYGVILYYSLHLR